MDIHGILQPSHLGIIRASGSQAAEFLHSQLSANILQMGSEQTQLAVYCSPQGRVLASLIVLQNTPEEFLLICSKDIIEVTLKRLSMFILRAKVQLSMATDLMIQAHTSAAQIGRASCRERV